jgi:hypothetical protein
LCHLYAIVVITVIDVVVVVVACIVGIHMLRYGILGICDREIRRFTDESRGRRQLPPRRDCTDQAG